MIGPIMFNEKIIIDISKHFSKTPGPRYVHEGDFSGESFRKKILYPKVKEVIAKNGKLVIILDGTAGYGTSFLEESFGGLIREDKISYDDLINVLEFISNEEPYLIDDIYNYLKEARDEQ